MIIVKLIGGLGNQMFQYALGRSLAIKNMSPLRLDISGYEKCRSRSYSLNVFTIAGDIASDRDCDRLRQGKIQSLLQKIRPNNSLNITERGFAFDSRIQELRGDIYLNGYWQSERYFKDIEPVIRSDFTINAPMGEQDKEALALIDTATAISLHVRRGDYISHSRTNAVHGTCSEEYYTTAIEFITSHVTHPHFFIFSAKSLGFN